MAPDAPPQPLWLTGQCAQSPLVTPFLLSIHSRNPGHLSRTEGLKLRILPSAEPQPQPLSDMALDGSIGLKLKSEGENSGSHRPPEALARHKMPLLPQLGERHHQPRRFCPLPTGLVHQQVLLTPLPKSVQTQPLASIATASPWLQPPPPHGQGCSSSACPSWVCPATPAVVPFSAGLNTADSEKPSPHPDSSPRGSARG